MLDGVKNLPDDPLTLKALIASMVSELTNRDAELKSRDLLIEKLKHQLSGLRRHQFGARSESLDQLELTLEEEEIVRAAEARTSTSVSSISRMIMRIILDGSSALSSMSVTLAAMISRVLEKMPAMYILRLRLWLCRNLFEPSLQSCSTSTC